MLQFSGPTGQDILSCMVLIVSCTGVLTSGLGMVVILSADICSCFIGWVFCPFVSVALSGSKGGMVAVCCLLGKSSGISLCVSSGVSW